jgi:hypothetical protein
MSEVMKLRNRARITAEERATIFTTGVRLQIFSKVFITGEVTDSASLLFECDNQVNDTRLGKGLYDLIVSQLIHDGERDFVFPAPTKKMLVQSGQSF